MNIKDFVLYCILALGGMFLKKVFTDTFKNLDLSIKNIWKKTRLVLTLLLFKILLIVNPQKAQLLILVIVSTAVVGLYLKAKKDRQHFSMG